MTPEHHAILRRVRAAGSEGLEIAQGWVGATLLLGVHGLLTVKKNRAWLTSNGARAVECAA